MGPSADEKDLADAYYEEQITLMNEGFLQARLLLPPPRVVVNDEEEPVPNDDNVLQHGNIS